jgi:succinate dehydrogenase flavin-adding protein (antitoxin of CptAB toxin-antitoxin module)
MTEYQIYDIRNDTVVDMTDEEIGKYTRMLECSKDDLAKAIILLLRDFKGLRNHE